MLFAVAAVGAVASALWMAVLTHAGGDTTRSFYASDTRAQAILVGAALAIGSVLWGPTGRAGRGPRCGAGASPAWWERRCCGCSSPPDSLLVFRGGFFVAALCTAGVIAVCRQSSRRPAVARCCVWRPLRYVGRISYGMYLWYWPLVLVLSAPAPTSQGYPLLGVRLVAIIAVATASAYLVELPIRRGRLPGWWAPLAMPVAASLAVLTTFLATVGVSDVAAASVGGDARHRARPRPRGGGDRGERANRHAPRRTPAPVKVLIVGDSMAGTLGVGLGQLMSQYGVVAVNEGSPGCSVSMDQLVKVLWFTDPPGNAVRERRPRRAVGPVARLGGRSSIPTSCSTWPAAKSSTRRWTRPGPTWGWPAFDSYLTNRFHQAIDVLGSARCPCRLADLSVLRHRRAAERARRGPRTIPPG